MSEERSFEELLKEESSVTIHNGAIVEGTVISVNENEIILNIRYKADGILTKSEYSNNPDVDLTKEVKVDDNEALLDELVKLAYASASKMAILPMQDVLKLDSNARMNLPGTVGTNWGWRMQKDALTDEKAMHLCSLVEKYNR